MEIVMRGINFASINYKIFFVVKKKVRIIISPRLFPVLLTCKHWIVEKKCIFTEIRHNLDSCAPLV